MPNTLGDIGRVRELRVGTLLGLGELNHRSERLSIKDSSMIEQMTKRAKIVILLEFPLDPVCHARRINYRLS